MVRVSFCVRAYACAFACVRTCACARACVVVMMSHTYVPWLTHVCRDSLICVITHSCVSSLTHMCHDSHICATTIHTAPLSSLLNREVGGWGRDPFSRNFMKPTPRRKWYLATGRRFHWMVLDPIPQSLPVHFFGSRPQPPTSLLDLFYMNYMYIEHKIYGRKV